MKILVVSTLYAPNEIGGAETTARLVAEGLAEEGHRVATVSIAPDGVARTGEIRGVRCHYLKLANLYWLHQPGIDPPLWQKLAWHLIDAYNPVMGRRLGRILDAERPDVVHMHNIQGFSVAAWRAARRRGIPVVQTLHDYYLACPNSIMYKDGANCTRLCRECRVLGLPRRLLSNTPDAVTGVSRRVLERLEQRGLFARVARKLVINGCNLDDPTPPPRVDKRPGEPVTFGYFGRMEPIKGLAVLLEAMRRLPPDKATLLLGGRGQPDYVAALQRDYSAPNIRFLGFVQPAHFFGQVDVLVVPSLWEEPFPRVVHEAFSFGVPVFASRLGGLPEIIAPGRTGELFAPGDADALAALMGAAIETGFPGGRFFAATRASSRNYEFARILGQYRDVLAAAANAPA